MSYNVQGMKCTFSACRLLFSLFIPYVKISQYHQHKAGKGSMENSHYVLTDNDLLLERTFEQ